MSTIDSSCPLPRRSAKRALAPISLKETIPQIESSMRLRVIKSRTTMSSRATKIPAIPVISKSMPHYTYSQQPAIAKIKVIKESLLLAKPKKHPARSRFPRKSLKSPTPLLARALFAPASLVWALKPEGSWDSRGKARSHPSLSHLMKRLLLKRGMCLKPMPIKERSQLQRPLRSWTESDMTVCLARIRKLIW